MAVEVLARPVVAHGCARVGVPGGDLHISKIHAGVEPRGDEGMPQHVRVRCQPKCPWRFELAPDELHKAKISGGTHDVLLPTINADPIIEGVNRRPEVTLVTYLRISLGLGGFPGFQFGRAAAPV